MCPNHRTRRSGTNKHNLVHNINNLKYRKKSLIVD